MHAGIVEATFVYNTRKHANKQLRCGNDKNSEHTVGGK